MGTSVLGKWGEGLAAEYLRKKRYHIIAANYHSRFGEIDLIAVNKKAVAFVEVKLRKSDAFGRASEFVGVEKQRKIVTSAKLWLMHNPTKLQPRFDIIEIYAPNGVGESYTLNHIENAFQG